MLILAAVTVSMIIATASATTSLSSSSSKLLRGNGATTSTEGRRLAANNDGIRMRGLADFEWDLRPVDGFPVVTFSRTSAEQEVALKYNYTGTLGDAGSYAKYLSFRALSSDCNTETPVDPTVLNLKDSAGLTSLDRILSSVVNNEIDLFVDVNQAAIKDSAYYAPAPDGLSAAIRFCVRGAYAYDDDNDPLSQDEEINFYESVVTITVDLTANFALTGVAAERNGADAASGNLQCEARAYFCTDDRQPVLEQLTYKQGDSLQFCVEAAEGDRDRFWIRDVAETDLEQDNNNDGVYREIGVDQFDDVVADYQSNYLTSKSCVDGICQVKTQLVSKYFANPFPNPLDIFGSALCSLGTAPPGQETGIHVAPPTKAPSPSPSTSPSKAPSSSPTFSPTSAFPTPLCIPSATNCCEDSDCTDPYGGICNKDTGTCACDATKCESVVSVNGDKICMSNCDCPEDCNSANGQCRGSPELNCASCDDSVCVDGYTCDGRYCVPAGRCTARKQKLCDNAYFEITGNPDQRSKCCPDSSACVQDTLKLGWNSVCSTTCGNTCMGTISSDKDYPKVLCAAAPTNFAEFLSLEMCYEDIVQPFCEATTPIVDVGSELCKNQPGHVGESAGCSAPYMVCCQTNFVTQLNCDPAFIVPDVIPA